MPAHRTNGLKQCHICGIGWSNEVQVLYSFMPLTQLELMIHVCINELDHPWLRQQPIAIRELMMHVCIRELCHHWFRCWLRIMGLMTICEWWKIMVEWLKSGLRVNIFRWLSESWFYPLKYQFPVYWYLKMDSLPGISGCLWRQIRLGLTIRQPSMSSPENNGLVSQDWRGMSASMKWVIISGLALWN